MKIKIFYLTVFFFSIILNTFLAAQDITTLGGELTHRVIGEGFQSTILQTPTDVLEFDTEKYNLFIDGFLLFHGQFNSREGLGPVFNNNSCEGCHFNNGRGLDRFSRSINGQFITGSPMLIMVSDKRNSVTGDGSPIPIRPFRTLGTQIRDHANDSFKNKFDYNIRLNWKDINGNYPDGTPYKLRKPIVSFVLPDGRTHRKVGFSLRMSPHIVAPGLLEAISEDTILSFSDPEDANADGIKGVPQYVKNKRTGVTELGRFGFKASHPTLEQQNAAASFFDMGVTNSIFHHSPNRIEMSEEFLHKMTFYLALTGVPEAVNQTDPSVTRGKEIFQEINCSGCHRFNITTGTNSEHSELHNQIIHPFTDMLLHDMGHGLADGRPEHNATRKMWRTTPLWGIGKAALFRSAGSSIDKARKQIRYLHDARARTLEEAILWHGGEAENSKNAFKNLSKEDRGKLIKFLLSI